MMMDPEQDLHHYTRYRWIYNEEKELAKRSVPFNLERLIDAAIRTTDGKSKYFLMDTGSKVLKCKEGLNNKVILMTMDDGAEVIAKPPNPNAGPPYLTTASEVATHEFLRDVLNMPVPKIIAWSADRTNAVGAEYILQEKVSGKPLASMWHRMPKKSKLDRIAQVAELENRLASLTFNKHGCIYFRDSIEDQEVASQPLITSPPVSSAIVDRFVLGPLITAELWGSEDTPSDVDRGPWETVLSYITALGHNEKVWARKFAKPRISPHSATGDPESPESYHSLLEQYLTVAPYLIPENIDTHSPTLWHSDLHRDNLFVDPDTNKITQIIDWQSIVVAPFGPVEENWAVPKRPDDYDSLGGENKARADANVESLTYHKYYRSQTLKKNHRHWACIDYHQNLELRTNPVKLVTKAWKNDEVFYLRDALMKLADHWDELIEGVECPIHFSEEERRIHAKEGENVTAIGEVLKLLHEQNVLPEDGMVDPIDYEKAKQNVVKFKQIYVGSGSTPEEKRLLERLWPYRDTGS
ncbi:phosphotransferase enzyme family protein [Xylogone sp. PMI_703]|nr:phosphotransferase enzyme family protein [Xylogone sp. PMI_703]